MAVEFPGDKRLENQPQLSIKRDGILPWRTDKPAYAGGNVAAGEACSCCGWTGRDNQYVTIPDGPSKPVVLCALCVLPTAIGHALNTGKGRLVILPELTQTEIINLFRWAYLGAYAQKMLAHEKSWLRQPGNEALLGKANALKPLAGAVGKLEAMLAQRGEDQLRRQFITNVPSEMFFPVAFSQLSEELYAKRSSHFAALRFVPHYAALTDEQWQQAFADAVFEPGMFASRFPNPLTS